MEKETFNFFPFQWSFEDETNDEGIMVNIIRAYGWNEKNESVYCCINNFHPFIWIELPTEIEWTESKINILVGILKSINKAKGGAPTKISVVNRKKLYYAHIEQVVNKNGEKVYRDKRFPFLEVYFNSTTAMNQFVFGLKRGIHHASFPKGMKLNHYVHDKSATPIIKLFALQNLPSSNWIKVSGLIVPDDEKESTRKREYIVSYKDMKALSQEESIKLPIVYPSVLSFDIEVYSSVETAMPKFERPKDVVFMVGATLIKYAENAEKRITKYLLYITPNNKFTIKQPKSDELENKDNCEIVYRQYRCEGDLYVGFTELIKEVDADVLIGYNIFGFDISYMFYRAQKQLRCLSEFDRMGCIFGKHSELKDI